MILKIPAGSQVFLGAPAKPMAAERAAAIAAVVDSVSSVVEALGLQRAVLVAARRAARLLASPRSASVMRPRG
jgi:hypothetical protein